MVRKIKVSPDEKEAIAFLESLGVPPRELKKNQGEISLDKLKSSYGIGPAVMDIITDKTWVGWGWLPLSGYALKILKAQPQSTINLLFKTGDGVDGNTAAHLAHYLIHQDPNSYHYYPEGTQFSPDLNNSPGELLKTFPFEALVGIDFDAAVLKEGPLSKVREATLKLQIGDDKGSGVYVEGGMIFTAEHVVNSSRDLSITFKTVQGTEHTVSREYIVFQDSKKDLAIIYLPPHQRPLVSPLPLIHELPPQETPLYAFGYGFGAQTPFLSLGLMHHPVKGAEEDVIHGIKSSIDRFDSSNRSMTYNNGRIDVSTDRALLEWFKARPSSPSEEPSFSNSFLAFLHTDHGYSGGPITNAQGELTGIISFGFNREWAITGARHFIDPPPETKNSKDTIKTYIWGEPKKEVTPARLLQFPKTPEFIRGKLHLAKLLKEFTDKKKIDSKISSEDFKELETLAQKETSLPTWKLHFLLLDMLFTRHIEIRVG